MILPLRTDSPLRTTPYMNWALIAANVAMFVVHRVHPQLDVSLRLYSHDPWLPAFFTYALLHGDALHLAGNMLFLYIFGNNVNDKMGHVGYLAFYLAGAVVGGIGFLLTADAGASVVGASGAVAAVTGAYLVLFPRSSITVFYFMFFFGTIEIPSLWFVLLFFVKDLFGVVSGGEGVAYGAHIGGTLFGFGTSLALLAAHLLPRDQFDAWALVKQWNRRRQYRDMVAKGYNPFGYTPVAAGGPPGRGDPADAGPPDPRAGRVSDLRAEIAEAIAHHDLPRAAGLYLELRGVDPQQVLSRQAQLDVANQLNAEQQYPQAAEAYEAFLRTDPKFEQIEHVELMLGLIYARYLQQYDRAKGYLVKAIARLHGERELTMAKSELRRIEPLTVQTGPAL
jgi:membrane associated rhomboid family serine protease